MAKRKLILITGWGQDAESVSELKQLLSSNNSNVLEVEVISLVELYFLGSKAEPTTAVNAKWSSYALGLQKFIISQGSKQIILCGWSTGGTVVLELLTEPPSSVKRAILIGSFPKFVQDQTCEFGTPLRQLHYLKHAVENGDNDVLKAFVEKVYVPIVPEASVISRHLKVLKDTMRAILLDGLKFLESIDLRVAIPHIKMPLLLLHGDKDAVVPIAASKAIHALLPSASFLSLKEAGHSAPISHAQIVATEIKAFLASEVREHKNIERHFSRAATVYEKEASVQKSAAKVVCDWLGKDGAPVGAGLEVGCGTGFLTRELLSHYPRLKLTAVDISARMIAEGRRQLKGESQVSWMIADIFSASFPEKFQHVVSNVSIQWIQPIDMLFKKLRGVIDEGGRFAFSVMVEGTLGELRELRLKLFPDKPPRGKLPSTNEIKELLVKNGFNVHDSASERYSVNYKSGWSFLQQIHAQGFTGGEVSLAEAPLLRRELEMLAKEYEKRHSRQLGGVSASYCVSYFVCSA